ncbi:MlaD family protein [Nocardia sp. XZ_19_385]|uniref:MlaD family protein n=1 Tax=Nocardia sp. XZ_19_385 TaxID=2769488 RepID=UPI00188EF300|nr:MlaD family protein [Nocardia sp. XZ_19_385]
MERWLPLARTPDRHEAATHRREFRLGIIGAAFVAVLLVATAVIYVLPLGKSTYTAELSEAQSIREGAQVRVAGITVGSVTELELLPDRVRMRFTVDREVFLGADTSLEIRMLTAVGGHYLAVFPAGDKPLGKKMIPPDRVRLPYSLVQTLQDAAAPVSEVDGDTLRNNLAALQESIQNSPDALRQMGTATQSFVTILQRQNQDVSRALTVLDEYLGAVDVHKSLLGTFVRELGILLILGLNKRAEIEVALTITAQLLSRIAALEPSYRDILKPMTSKLRELLPQLEQLSNQLDVALPAWKELRERLVAATTSEEGLVIDHSMLNVCVPVPGRGC